MRKIFAGSGITEIPMTGPGSKTSTPNYDRPSSETQILVSPSEDWVQWVEDLNERYGIMETQRTGEPMSDRIQRTRDIDMSGFGVIFISRRGKPQKR